MSERIKVTEDQAIKIATLQYERAKKYRRADEWRYVKEDVFVKNRAAEIMKNGAHPDELRLAEGDQK